LHISLQCICIKIWHSMDACYIECMAWIKFFIKFILPAHKALTILHVGQSWRQCYYDTYVIYFCCNKNMKGIIYAIPRVHNKNGEELLILLGCSLHLCSINIHDRWVFCCWDVYFQGCSMQFWCSTFHISRGGSRGRLKEFHGNFFLNIILWNADMFSNAYYIILMFTTWYHCHKP